MLPVKGCKEEAYLLMATENGLIKKTPLSQFQDVRGNGLIAIKAIPLVVIVEALLPLSLAFIADWNDWP